MGAFTRATEFRLGQTKRTVLCGLTNLGGPPIVSIADATCSLIDATGNVVDVIPAIDWWKPIPPGSAQVDSAGTVSVEIEFTQGQDLLDWLCANQQTVQIFMHSTTSFTIDAKFMA